MKKIFTLLFSTALLSSAFAQYGQKGQRDNDKSNDVYVANTSHDYDKGFAKPGKGYDKGAYIFTVREKDMEIAQINREYAFKIQSVKNKFAMSWFQKKRMINNLEEQRDSEIFQVMRKFNSPKNKFGDYGRKNDKRW